MIATKENFERVAAKNQQDSIADLIDPEASQGWEEIFCDQRDDEYHEIQNKFVPRDMDSFTKNEAFLPTGCEKTGFMLSMTVDNQKIDIKKNDHESMNSEHTLMQFNKITRRTDTSKPGTNIRECQINRESLLDTMNTEKVTQFLSSDDSDDYSTFSSNDRISCASNAVRLNENCKIGDFAKLAGCKYENITLTSPVAKLRELPSSYDEKSKLLFVLAPPIIIANELNISTIKPAPNITQQRKCEISTCNDFYKLQSAAPFPVRLKERKNSSSRSNLDNPKKDIILLEECAHSGVTYFGKTPMFSRQEFFEKRSSIGFDKLAEDFLKKDQYRHDSTERTSAGGFSQFLNSAEDFYRLGTRSKSEGSHHESCAKTSHGESSNIILTLKLPSTAMTSSIPSNAGSAFASNSTTSETRECKRRTLEWVSTTMLENSGACMETIGTDGLQSIDEATPVLSKTPDSQNYISSNIRLHPEVEFYQRHRKLYGRQRTRKRGRSGASQESDQGVAKKIEKDRGGGTMENFLSEIKKKKLFKILTIFFVFFSVLQTILCLIYGYSCYEKMGYLEFRLLRIPILPISIIPKLDCVSEISSFEPVLSYAFDLSKTLAARKQLVIRQYYDEIKDIIKNLDDLSFEELRQTADAGQSSKSTQNSNKKEKKAARQGLECIFHGLRALNGSLRRMPNHIAEMQMKISRASREIVEGLEIIQSKLGFQAEDPTKFQLYDLFVPNVARSTHRELAQMLKRHLVAETKSLKNMTNVIGKALNETWAVNNRSLVCMRQQKLLISQAAATAQKCHAINIILSGHIPIKIQEMMRKLGIVMCHDEVANEKQKNVWEKQNSASEFLLQAEMQAQSARAIILHMVEKFQRFDEDLKINANPTSAVSRYYAKWKRVRRWDIAADIFELKKRFLDISGAGIQTIGGPD